MVFPPRSEDLDSLLSEIDAPVRAFLRRVLPDPDRLEDVVSETHHEVLLAARRQRIRRPVSLALRIAWRRAVDAGRRARTRRVVAFDEALAPTPDPSRLRDLEEWVQAGLSRLDPEERALLHLRYGEDLPDRRIAEILELPRGTVARRLHAARRRLAGLLERLGGGVRVTTVLLSLGVLARAGRGETVGGAATAAASFGLGVVAVKKTVALSALVAALLALLWVVVGTLASSDDAAGTPSPAGDAEAATGTDPGASGRGGVRFESPSLQTSDFSTSLRGPRYAGRIQDLSGRPVRDARIVWARPEEGSAARRIEDLMEDAARGDAEGRFAMTVPDGRPRTLAVSAPGFSPAILRDCPPREDLSIVLGPKARLVGRVLDLKGRPVEGAELRFVAATAGLVLSTSTRTQATGDFVLEAPPPEATLRHPTLEAGRDGFATTRRLLSARDWAEPITLRLARGATLTGVVTVSSVPRADCEVVFRSFAAPPAPIPGHGPQGHRAPFGSGILARTRTDAEGRYVFHDLPVRVAGIEPMPHSQTVPRIGTGGPMPRHAATLGEVIARVPDLPPTRALVPVAEEEEARLERNLEIFPGATVSGRVLGADGRPLEGWPVALREFVMRSSRTADPAFARAPLGPWVWTDAEGRFVHPAVPCTRGPRSVCLVGTGAADVGGSTDPVSVRITRGGRKDVGDLEVPVTPLRGRVTGPDGAPLPGARVRFGPFTHGRLGARIDLRTDEEGAFAGFRPEAAETFAVGVTAPGHVGLVRAEVDWAGGLEFVLERGRVLEGRVVTPYGDPAAGLSVHARGHRPGPARRIVEVTQTDAAGRFRFAELDDLAYEVTAIAPGRAPDAGVVVTPDEGPLRLALPEDGRRPRSTLRVRIEDARGLPFSGSITGHLRWETDDGEGEVDLVVEGPGEVAFSEVPIGTWPVRLVLEGRPPLERDLEVTLGPRRLVIGLEAGHEMTGHVVLPGDGPIDRPIHVRARPADSEGSVMHVRVAVDGSFRLEGLAAGVYLVDATARAVLPRRMGERGRPTLVTERPRRVTLPGEGLGLWLPLVRSVSAQIVVTAADEARRKARGLAIVLVGEDGRLHRPTPIQQGPADEAPTYHLVAVPEGDYRLQVRDGKTVLHSETYRAPGRRDLHIPAGPAASSGPGGG